MLERRHEQRSRREVARIEADDLGAPTGRVENQGHHDAVILCAARAGGDEEGFAGIAARAEIVPRDGAGLKVDPGELLLQAYRVVAGIAGDIGVALTLAEYAGLMQGYSLAVPLS